MKRAARLGGLLLFLLLPITLLFSWRHLLVSVRTPTECVLTFDNLFCHEYQQTIVRFATCLDMQLASDLRRFSALLQHEFPLITLITTELESAGALHVSIGSAKPLCLINESQVLVENDLIVERTAYEQYALVGLPTFCALPEHLASWQAGQIKALLSHLSLSLFDHYDCWLDIYPEMMLACKDEQKFTIITRAETLDAGRVIHNGERLQEMLAERGSFASSKGKQWVADMRFSKLIVVVAK
jgi:hypothetical protein